jgi:4a-hydroxytetrahydrobiopterin dehydratase
MSDSEALADKTCVPCRGGVPPLTQQEYSPLLAELDAWQVVGDHHLFKDFRFADFLAALAFVNRAAAIADEQGHHPEITLGWGHAKVEIWTHKIDGLTESDFVLAAKYDRLVG